MLIQRSDAPDTASNTAAPPRGRVRWTVCALLFFATTINYMARQVLAILAPDLQKIIGWDEQQYGNIVAAFQASYALGLITFGGILDRIGTRRGFAFAIGSWSLAAMAHALASTPFGFGVARFALGLGESGNFPCSIKTIGEWFPQKERATATGLFNSGANIGAIVAPLTVPLIALHFGWQWAFILVGALGFIWLVLWQLLYRSPETHPSVSPSELAYIHSDAPGAGDEVEPKIPWASVLRYKHTWAFVIGKFLTDPVWWFFLSWLPKFLKTTYGMDLSKIGPPLVVIYLIADAGSIGGGYLSSYFIKRGWDVARARKTAMLICALCVVPIIFASRVSNVWVAVALIGLATAAHQGWSANIFTLVSDNFPKRATGSVVGIGGMAGALGGMFVASGVGWLLQTTNSNYVPLFYIAGFAYIVAWLIIWQVCERLPGRRFESSVQTMTATDR